MGSFGPQPGAARLMIAILPEVRGYCSCSTRDLWAPAHGWVTPTRSVLFRSEHYLLKVERGGRDLFVVCHVF
ncbi:hypothetical protein T07_4270 [Trichinella nelsoni]|uniref:Uncharacterized protein n=1 Tax=Trichinella nelsoni TaxID=6336 RepID=A0A0V0SIN5_9BILA|nr:hypothetical protein T07_4270 [Trichinella nelsoni]